MAEQASYRVVHETRYAYSDTIAIARQLAHLQPREIAWQKVRSHCLQIEPAPTERTQDIDYFGNAVVRFAVETPHDELIVNASSVVDIDDHAPSALQRATPWEAARATPGLWGPDVDLNVEEFRLASPMTPMLAETAAYAAQSFVPGRSWLDAMLDLTQRIQGDFTYDPKATTVTTQITEVLRERRGVCQDFAHFMISCLRSLGLSARYVSGYVVNRRPAEKARMAGADASHAWVSAHCPGIGWVDYDPTNGKQANLEFITLGWGREFADVSPLRGVVLGTGTQTLTVAVNVQPV